MPLGDYLKGYEPNLNVEDSGFEPIKYKGAVVVNVLRKEDGKYGERVQLEMEVTDGEFKGRRFWKRYPTNSEDSVKRLVDDLFTSNLPYDFSSEDAEQATFGQAIGKTIYVRAYPNRSYMEDGRFLTKDEIASLSDEEKAEFPIRQAVRIIKQPKDVRTSPVPF